MVDVLRGCDIEPLIKLAADIGNNDGHVQFSALVGALVLLCKVQGIERTIVHRAVDATWDFNDAGATSGPIKLYDQG